MAHRWQVRVEMKADFSASESILLIVIHADVICCFQCVDRSSKSIAACRSERLPSDVARQAFASQHLSVCFRFAICVRLSVCLRLPATTHHSDRCNNDLLICESVVEVLLRNRCLAGCLRLGSPHHAFTSHCVSVCLRFVSIRRNVCLPAIRFSRSA